MITLRASLVIVASILMVSDAWAGLTRPEQYILSRNVLPALTEDRLTASTYELLLEPIDKVICFSESKNHNLKTLAQHDIGLVSITENIDYSTAQGKLFTQMLGSFAEYFSESLAGHIRKGQDQRAEEGRHTGGIPNWPTLRHTVQDE